MVVHVVHPGRDCHWQGTLRLAGKHQLDSEKQWQSGFGGNFKFKFAMNEPARARGLGEHHVSNVLRGPSPMASLNTRSGLTWAATGSASTSNTGSQVGDFNFKFKLSSQAQPASECQWQNVTGKFKFKVTHASTVTLPVPKLASELQVEPDGLCSSTTSSTRIQVLSASDHCQSRWHAAYQCSGCL